MSGPGVGTAPRAGRAAAGRPAAPRAEAWRAHLPTAALALLGLVLYGRGLLLGFVGDDYTLLDAALRHPLGELLSGRHGILGYYRPVSRELYFWGWGRVAGLGPGGFHLVNALTYAAVVVMIERLGRAWAGPRAGRLAAAAFLVFPPGSALLAWVSCAQDLIMLFWALAALLLQHRGRTWAAGAATLMAALAKETAVVLPLALAAMEWTLRPRAPLRERLVRLAPGAVGLAVAAGLSLAARAGWPAGAAVTVWSPGQFAGAWRLPLDALSTLLPPETGTGIARTLETRPWWLALAAGLGALAVPAGGPAAGSARTPVAAGRAGRAVIAFGLTLALLAMLPVGFVSERWRGYFFSLTAVGGALAVGALLAPRPPALARGLLALAAVVHYGAGSVYRPLDAGSGPGRHPHVNYAFFRDTGALSDGLLAGLAPWCDSLRALPRSFLAGVPPNQTFETAIGAGLRVTCRDTVARVRFLADFTPADAAAPFGVLRYDPGSGRFAHERADARVRARVGEGFLLHARYDVAAACFESAAGAAPDRELSYPLAVARAADGRADDARRGWEAARARGQVLDPATMASRLAGDAAADGRAAADTLPPLAPLAAAVLHAPWEGAAHRVLGRALLARGRPREATFELAVAAGIGRGGDDLAWLARGYEAMELVDEALGAYRRALEGGLPADLYAETRDRYLALARREGAALDRPRSGP